jgi:glycosyltransferase involved in cell wall biosynthesis
MNSKKSYYANIISFFATPFKSIYLLIAFKNISFRHLKDYAFLLQDKKYLKKVANKYGLNENALNIICKVLRVTTLHHILKIFFKIIQVISRFIFLDRLIKHINHHNEISKLNILIDTMNSTYRAQEDEITQYINNLTRPIHFYIHIDINNSNINELNRTLDSLMNQLYKKFSIVIDNNIDNKIIKHLQNYVGTTIDIIQTKLVSENNDSYLIFLHEGCCLNKYILYEYVSLLNINYDIDLIYTDEVLFKALKSPYSRYENRRYHTPFSKPGWSPDYLETFNYINYGACFKSVGGRINGYLNYYDYVLQYTEEKVNVQHIQRLLISRSDEYLINTSNDADALILRLKRTQRSARVKKILPQNIFSISNDNITLPKISIVIPTAGNCYKSKTGEERDLIIELVKDLRDIYQEENLEIIVVHNDDLSRAQLCSLKNNNSILVNYGKNRNFNISKKLNLGVKRCTNEVLILMNDDIKFINKYWIRELYAHLLKKHVGVVGAKLLYPNLSIQHVGVVFNYGNPDHVSRFANSNDNGYFNSISSARNYSAVTGAVMMTRKSLYNLVKGYDENLAISFNDVDYCLKIRHLGYHVVYEPKSMLIHLESISRKPSMNVDELNRFYEKWPLMDNDPFYNQEMLSVCPPTFEPYIKENE